MELGEQAKEFEKRGLGVAAITYDAPGVLKHFAARTGLTIPLLSDEGSKVIRSFGILNDNVPSGTPFHGVPFPGTYIVTPQGVVQSKYFEEDYAERTTAASILTREFGGASGASVRESETRHLKVRTSAANGQVWPGAKVLLELHVELKPGMHVYAPPVENYIPVRWSVSGTKAWLPSEPVWPQWRTLRLEAIRETVPVYEGTFRVLRHVTVGQAAQLKEVLGDSRQVKVEGSFRYQACDDRVCYQPVTVPLEWTFELKDLDRQRAPAEARGGRGPA